MFLLTGAGFCPTTVLVGDSQDNWQAELEAAYIMSNITVSEIKCLSTHPSIHPTDEVSIQYMSRILPGIKDLMVE